MLSKNYGKAPKKPFETHQNLTQEEKEKKLKYGCGRYKNLSEDEKNTLVEYKTLYYDSKKVL